jgi:hypothetical protein
VSLLFQHRDGAFSVAAAETKGQTGSWDIYCTIRSQSRQEQKKIPSVTWDGKKAGMSQNLTTAGSLLRCLISLRAENSNSASSQHFSLLTLFLKKIV